MSTSLFVGSHGQQGLADGTNPLTNGLAYGAFSYEQAVTAYELKWIVERTLVPANASVQSVAPGPPLASTTLFMPLAGQQGVSDGLGAYGWLAAVDGCYSHAQAVTAYELKWIVERTLGATVTLADADAVPRVSTTATVPVNVTPDADVMIGIYGDATVPVKVDPVVSGSGRVTVDVPSVPLAISWQATATGRVTAAVQAALRWTVGATATGRIVAAVLYPIRMAASSSVMIKIFGGVVAAVRWLIGSRGRVGGYTRARATDLSGLATYVQDDSEGRP